MRLLISLLVLCVTMTHTLGQESKLTPGQEKLQALESLIGTWKGTDASGKTVTISYQWINNKSYIEVVVGDYREVIGWDLKRQQVVAWGFGTHGGQGEVLWVEEDAGKWSTTSDWLDRWGQSTRTSAKVTVQGDKLRVENQYGDNPVVVMMAQRVQSDPQLYRANTQRWQDLFNQHAAEKLASEYAEDCNVLNVGTHAERLSNREEVQDSFSKLFEAAPAVRVALTDVAYQRLSDTIVMESGVFNFSELGSGAEDSRGMYSTLYENQNGQWKVVYERTWLPPVTELSDAERKTLESGKLGSYLVGNWTATGTIEGEPISASMTVQPAAGGSALFFSWTTSSADGSEQGSAISGVDPLTGDVLEFTFADAGKTRWENRYSKPLGDQVQGTTQGTHTSFDDGKKVVEDITITRTSRDRFEYRLSSDGETRLSWVFERTL